jgi:hypothetical protein
MCDGIRKKLMTVRQMTPAMKKKNVLGPGSGSRLK